MSYEFFDMNISDNFDEIVELRTDSNLLQGRSLGDIIINLSKIKNKNNKNKFQEELNKLWVHGLVHLFGYQHKKEKDFNTMSKIEKKYLEYLN